MNSLLLCLSLSAGIGMDISRKPYTYPQNPVGIVDISCKKDNAEVFYTHVSSIPNPHDNGYNWVGIRYTFKLSGE